MHADKDFFQKTHTKTWHKHFPSTASLNSVNCAEKFHGKLNHCHNTINNCCLTHSAFIQQPKSKPDF